MRASTCLLRVAPVFLLLLPLGCGEIRQLTMTHTDRAAGVEKKIQEARAMDAEECAPKELAWAEASLEMANHEAREYETADYIERYYVTAEARADELLAKTEPCYEAKMREMRDADGDGVPDYRDKCPNTPRGAKVDAQGCALDSDGDGVADHADKCPNTPRGAKVDAQGCALDSDGDGVADHADRCPNTPQGAKVDAQGCALDSDGDGVADHADKCPNTPRGAKVDAQGCPLDSDGDGVADHADKCPNTPRGAKVDAQGCPLDSDGDGVADHADKCPGTKAGVKVDAVGCAVVVAAPETIELVINFAFDSAEVQDQYLPEIKKVADFMKKHPDVDAVIEGHTDSVGTELYNLKLSGQRANSVAKVLNERYGIDLERVTAQSLGEAMPIASNDTAEGRAKNRRIYAILEAE